MTAACHHTNESAFYNGTPTTAGIDKKRSFRSTTKLGLRYALIDDTALKFEVGKIKTNTGQGLFNTTPNKSSVTIVGFSIDVIF